MPATTWRPDGGWGGLPGVVADFWAERHLCLLTTLGRERRPHVVPVGIALDPDERCAWVITGSGSVKVANVRRDGLVAAAQVDGARWSTLYGSATVRADAASVARACERYAARYRVPRPNPARVALRIEVDRIVTSVPPPR